MPYTISLGSGGRALLFALLSLLLSGSADGQDTLRAAQARLQAADFVGAARMLEPLARSGHPVAARLLGELHYQGRGVNEDENAAFRLFEQAARGEDAEAMFWLGRMYLLGHGPAKGDVDADRTAARWFFEAGRRGHADAQYHLGLLFFAGTGVQRNTDEALKWIQRAAASGHEAARSFVNAAEPGRTR